jgi:anaerobic dimethyl sulfoxide reductase subunit A
VKDGAIVRLVPDPTKEENINNPRAIPCLRGRAQIHRVYAADRIKYPMKRVGKRGQGNFERISWDEALNTIADQMKRIKDKYGNAALYIHYASGVNWKGPDGRNPMARLMVMFGGYQGYYNSYSTACYSSVLPYITAAAGNSSDDVLNSRLIVLFGDNSIVTRAGGDNIGYYYLKAKENGTKFISIDPILTDTAIALGAEWIPINGGTDVALIAAMANVMVKENLYDKEFMATHAVGFDEDTLPEGAPANSSWMAYIMGKGDGIEKTPEWAAPITGVPATTIVRLAREIALTKPCAMFQGWGWQRRAQGEQPVRALPILAAMTGNFGVSGGGPGLRPTGMAFNMDSAPSVAANPIKVLFPVFKWPDFITRGTEMTTGPEDRLRNGDHLEANMKFMWNLGGNTIINQHSDINLTTKILQDETKLEMLVVTDVSMTPSAKFADILLPDTTGFEAEEIITGEGHSEKGNHAWALLNHKVVEPMYEAKPSLWVAEQLADRLGLGDQFRDGHSTPEDWEKDIIASAQKNYPDFPSLEEFRKVGIYKVSSDKPTVAFAAFRADPAANPLKTQTGKIEVYSPYLASLNDPDQIPAVPKYIPEWEGVGDPLRAKYPLMMSSTHWVARSHSTFDNVDYLREAHPQSLWINPIDAAYRGIKNGDMVRVFNDRGEVHLPAYVTVRIRQGTTNMPQGGWYAPDANGVDTRGCANVLTKYQPTPFARGNPQHTNLVQVEKL